MTSHSDGDAKGKFCALRDEACGHANYKKVCKPGWDSPTGPKYNAHHLLCVADVTEIVLGAWGIQGIIRQTQWCINKGPNMYAMPLWGHTFKHYLKKQGKGLAQKAGATAPGFKNIPQHNSDHHSYQLHDVKPKLNDIVDQIKKQKKKHTIDPKDIAGALNDLSKSLRSALRGRGQRGGGTDNAWKNGSTMKKWYMPFSMAQAGKATERTYPATSSSGDIAAKALAFLSK